MLNISKNTVQSKVDFSVYQSMQDTSPKKNNRVFIKTSFLLLIVVFALSCLPWTQNVRAKGYVTALQPDQRPQTIHSTIAGRIEKWLVSEGQYVKKGDTIAIISEVKDDYLNPNLLGNMESQIFAKEMSVKSYMDKVNALDKQIDAMIKNQGLKTQQALNKIEQARLKVQTDSADLVVFTNNLDVAKDQLNRAEELYKDGLKSLTDLESKRIQFQEAQAKKISQENKLLASQNAFINARVDYNNIENEFTDKIAKTESDKYASLSAMYEAEAQLTKLQNQYVNYSIRSGLYFIIAPQNGHITKALITGVGETVKEGTELVSIMPANADLAIEMYVRPIDLPLVGLQQDVRVQFDGWPAIIFSGWENMSFGMFDGKIVAIDNFTSPNGLYRVLVSPNENSENWPDAIRIGAGAKTIIMLENVPIWYEVWRQINGFPPKFYHHEGKRDFNEDVLKPLKPKS